MVDLGKTEDLGALVAELQETIDNGSMAPEDESVYKIFLRVVQVIRDARLAGVSDEVTLIAMQRAADQIEDDIG